MRFSSRTKRPGIFSFLILCVLCVALFGFLRFTTRSSDSTTTLATPPHTAPITLPAKCGGWSIIPDAHPNPGGPELFLGVAAVAPTDVWAVGNYTSTLSATVGLIEHWNGIKWSVLSHPNLGSDVASEHFNAVAASSTDDVWAVGDYVYRGAIQRTLAEHWNGSSWNIVASPNVGSNWNELSAVTAISAQDVWAVGAFTNGTDPLHTLIEHWNGSRWSIVASPNAGSSDNNLLGVAAASPHDVWAVGRYFSLSRSSTQTLIEHWDGTKWSIFANQNPDASSFATFTAITAISPQDVWAVGWDSYNKNTISKALIEHWNGVSWQIIRSPDIPTNSNVLLGITAVSADNVWAVGSTENTGSQKVLIERWDGTHWNIVPGASTPDTSELLRAAARIPGTSSIWAVGLLSNSTFIEFYC